MASDAEVNIVIVTLLCPDSKKETIKAYREEAVALLFTTQDLEVHTI